MSKRSVALCAAVAALAAWPVAAGAHPHELGEWEVPWTDSFTRQEGLRAFAGQAGAPQNKPAGPGISNLTLVGNSDKDGITNSDLAFYGNLAYAGNYGGFRILDITTDDPQTVVDKACNGPQNDVSVHEMGGKRFLFQSIDTPQTAEDGSSASAPLVENARVGYEGVRVFDVTNPRHPKFIDMIQTACGSHTHTLVPDGERAFIYVSSYPLGSNVTPAGATGPGDYRACTVPHKKISIIEVSAPSGRFTSSVKEQPLSSDTAFNRGFQACHDIQVFMPRKLAVGSCAGDIQIWDISDPANPTTGDGTRHTHIYSPSKQDAFEFVHSASITWDGKYMVMTDETGGGVTAECDGSKTTDGFAYVYPVVAPGEPAPPLAGRYTIPRPQGSQICVTHNSSFVPVRDRYVATIAYYQGGVSIVDFTNPAAPREVGFADLEDGTGLADEWSSYWYNGRVFSNSGLHRREPLATANRGVDVYRPAAGLNLSGAKTFSRFNPQTQEATQVP